MTDDSKGPDVEVLDQLARAGTQERDATPLAVSFERMPDGTTRVFRIATARVPPTDAELLEQARCLLWELIEEQGAELHDLLDNDTALCPEDDTCTCPRVAAANRILHGWTPPERR